MKYKDLESEWCSEWSTFMIDNFDKFVASSYSLILRNPNLTWETIYNNRDKFREIIHIMSYPNITLEIIQKNPDIPWDWKHLSSNPNITWEIIQANLDKSWDWYYISSNLNIT